MTVQDASIRFYIQHYTRPVEWHDKWSLMAVFKIFLYFAICFIVLQNFPNTIWDPELREITILIGTLGIWRYSWWFTHAVRAKIYFHTVYPKLRMAADKGWEDGWRPKHLHFMMTTFREERQVTDQVIDSICDQVREMGVPATIWLGSGDIYDERIIEKRLKRLADDIDLTFTMIRQNQPGKRMAMGLVLRAINRGDIDPNDVVVFMDGDSILAPGCVRKCATLMHADPELQAVTTDEEVICYGPKWVRHWLTMRFSQRRIAMGSHSLSNKVLTLTGRMSVFRANVLTNIKLIRLIEADHLNHWLWGDFRFLSGDDKSTWYFMLLQDAKMLYVPDALVYTVEYIEGNGLKRMGQNFLRWSGNMLRNGARALSLGPRKVGFFIWWCILDQRIAMWTMLVSPILAVMASTLHSAAYLISYTVWIAFSRMMLSLVLYTHCREINLTFPFILYFNQFITASVKVYCLFHLSKQRWANRSDQRTEEGSGFTELVRKVMADYVMIIYLSLLVLGILIYSDLVELPTLVMARTFILPPL